MQRLKKIASVIKFLKFATAEQNFSPKPSIRKPKRFFSFGATNNETETERPFKTERTRKTRKTFKTINNSNSTSCKPENFIKTINIAEKAKNFNFQDDDGDEEIFGPGALLEFRAAVAHRQQDDNSKTAQKSKMPSMEGIEKPSRDTISRANKTIRSMDLPAEERQETLYRKSSQSLDEDKDLETKSPELEVDSPLDLDSERFGGDTEVDSAWALDEAELTKDLRYRNDPKYSSIRWIIFPDDPFKHFWDVVVLINLVYTVFVVPFTTSFMTKDVVTVSIIDFVSIAVWVLDIILCFFTAFEDRDDKLVTLKQKIFVQYLTSWFIIDLISIIPLEFILSSVIEEKESEIPRLRQYLRLTKLLRLLRILKEGKKFLRYIDNLIKFKQGVDRFFAIIAGFSVFVHIGACVWFLQANLNNSDPTTWVNRDDNLVDSDSFEEYVTALYYIIATTVTVGYGDVHAGNTIERTVAVFLMFFGAFVYSFIIGTLSSIILTRDSHNRDLEAKLNTLIEIRQKYNLDSITFNLIKKALRIGFNRDDNEKTNFLNELPLNLKTKLSLIMHKPLLADIDFFRNRPPRFLANIGPYLKAFKISAFDYICTEGEYADEMYFIKSGTIEIVLKEYNNFPFMLVEKGYFFGEIDILFGETRKHSYRAQTDCTLLGMTKKNFSKIFFQEFQEIGAEVYNNALKRRVRQLKSYKEALAYCRANAHEDDKKYKPQTSNLFKGKLSIQGKNFLDSRLHFDEDSIVKAANSIIPETQVPETRDDREDGAGEEEEEELTARRELSNRTKNSKEKSEEDSDRPSQKKSKSDESIASESAGVSSISEVESRARSSLGLDIITKSQAQMRKSVKIEEDNNKPKSKKEVKMKGWTLVRHQLIKKRSTLRKTSRGPMSSGVSRRGGMFFPTQVDKNLKIETLNNKMELFEQNIKQILDVYKSLGISEDSL